MLSNKVEESRGDNHAGASLMMCDRDAQLERSRTRFEGNGVKKIKIKGQYYIMLQMLGKPNQLLLQVISLV